MSDGCPDEIPGTTHLGLVIIVDHSMSPRGGGYLLNENVMWTDFFHLLSYVIFLATVGFCLNFGQVVRGNGGIWGSERETSTTVSSTNMAMALIKLYTI